MRKGSKIPHRILIVDDSALARKILRRIVEHVGTEDAEAFEAGNGLQALRKLRRLHPDVVLTDFRMPVMDGIELLQKMRQDPELAHIPVIVVTAQADGATDFLLAGEGADAILHKPVTAEGLRGALENAVAANDPILEEVPRRG